MKRIKKEQLTAAAASAKSETREVLQTVYNELNNGQKKKLVNNDKVRAIFDRFGVEYE